MNDVNFNLIKNKKVLLFLIPILLILFIIVVFNSNNLSKLMGNSVSNVEYMCEDETYELVVNKCIKKEIVDAYLLGDVDKNGSITILDATYIQRHLSKVSLLDKYQITLGDVNQDGKLNDIDAKIIQEYLAKTSGYILDYNIGEELICAKDYNLNDNKCEKKLEVPAQEKNTFILRYNSNNGLGTMKDKHIVINTPISLEENAYQKTGYAFTGWRVYNNTRKKWLCNDNKYSDRSNGSCNEYSLIKDKAIIYIPAKEKEEVTLYAQWANSIYTVKFNANGGNGDMPAQNIARNGAYSLNKNAYTKLGYKFVGWALKNSAGEYRCYDDAWKETKSDKTLSKCKNGYYLYTDEEEIKNIADKNQTVELIAQWTNKYELVYDFNGGTLNNKTTMSYNHSPGTIKIDNVVPERKNNITNGKYIFSGWRVYNSNTNKWLCMTSSNNGYKWDTRRNCNNNGYVIKKSNDSLDIKDNDGVQTLILYAQWTGTYTIKFNANGGTGTMKDQTVTIGIKTTVQDNKYKRANFGVNGWTVQNSKTKKWLCTNGVYATSCSKKKIINLDEDISNMANAGEVLNFYSEWTNKFTVKYNANGGTGAMNNTLATYNTDTKTSANQFKRAGYVFAGWRVYNPQTNQWQCYKNIQKTQSAWANKSTCNNYGYVLRINQTIVNHTTYPGESVVFYAQWIEGFRIKFVAHGGLGQMADQIIKYGETTPINRNTYKKKDNVFSYWTIYNETRDKWLCYDENKNERYLNSNDCKYGYAHRDDEQKISQTALKGETLQLYAQWTEGFKIKFISHGGTGRMEDQSIKYGNSTSIRANKFVNLGYKFSYWTIYNETRDKWLCYDANKNERYLNSSDCKYGYVHRNDGQKISQTALKGETLQFYAQWKK